MNSRHLSLAIVFGSTLVTCGPSPAAAPAAPAVQTNSSAENSAAIQQTALDYLEGWYEGNAERMERSLHPELVKRTIRSNRLDTLSAERMVGLTRQGAGKAPAGQKKSTVAVLDVYGDIAMVRAESARYIDYLHLGKIHGRWLIINVLWTMRRPE